MMDTIFVPPKTPLYSLFLSHRAGSHGRPSPRDNTVRLRFLPLVLLVRIAQVSLPEIPSQRLVPSFIEVFEILHFIERYKSTDVFNHVKETEVARAVWMAREFKHFPLLNFKMVHRSDLLRAKAIMDELPSIMPDDMVGKELSSLIDSVNQKSYSTIGALHYLIQDMFVDSLHGLLAQLPGAIFNAVYRSPPEEFEERVRLGLKYLCKFETWDGISWEPPPECNCSSLLPTETPLDEPNVAAQVPTQPEGSKADHDEIGGSNGSSAPGDVIINV